jgi:hypothetical protein
VVMLSLENFEALDETAYLLGSPANAKRFLESMHALENGQGITRSIDLPSRISHFPHKLGKTTPFGNPRTPKQSKVYTTL